MTAARAGHTATLMPNGQVLVVGGLGSSGVLGSAELYTPGADRWSATASMATARHSHTTTLLGSGDVIAVGGNTRRNPFPPSATATSEIYAG